MNPAQLICKEGESPLKAVRKALGNLSREKFAARIGTVSSTVKRWEEGGKIMLTLEQAKNLNRELRSLHMTIEDLPNSLGPYAESA
jgi:ribosome-binding protein aMBF1 (putative translation factor)